MLTRKLAAGVALSALALAVSTAAYAQQTTGAIRGQVTDDAGKPLSGVTVTVTHLPTGTHLSSRASRSTRSSRRMRLRAR